MYVMYVCMYHWVQHFTQRINFCVWLICVIALHNSLQIQLFVLDMGSSCEVPQFWEACFSATDLYPKQRLFEQTLKRLTRKSLTIAFGRNWLSSQAENQEHVTEVFIHSEVKRKRDNGKELESRRIATFFLLIFLHPFEVFNQVNSMLRNGLWER